MSFELFCRYWNPHQVKVNCTCSLQAHRPQTGWNKKVDDVDSWLSRHQPIRRMLEDSGMLTLTPSLKLFPWKPLRGGLLSISYLDSLLGAYSKHYTCLHHNLVSINWLHHAQVSGPSSIQENLVSVRVFFFTFTFSSLNLGLGSPDFHVLYSLWSVWYLQHLFCRGYSNTVALGWAWNHKVNIRVMKEVWYFFQCMWLWTYKL